MFSMKFKLNDSQKREIIALVDAGQTKKAVAVMFTIVCLRRAFAALLTNQIY
ncbi:MAG: hypothetical protein MRK01_03305 [Candidatus Scalindua sp.]|nr:hypothetical protein [Candidatus Scalindua sp.]